MAAYRECCGHRAVDRTARAHSVRGRLHRLQGNRRLRCSWRSRAGAQARRDASLWCIAIESAYTWHAHKHTAMPRRDDALRDAGGFPISTVFASCRTHHNLTLRRPPGSKFSGFSFCFYDNVNDYCLLCLRYCGR